MLSGNFSGFGMKNALPAPEFDQTPKLPMGSRLFSPNPKRRRNWLSGINFQ